MITEWIKRIVHCEEDSTEMLNNLDTVASILHDLDWSVESVSFPAIDDSILPDYDAANLEEWYPCCVLNIPAFTLSREEIAEMCTDVNAVINGHVSLGSLGFWDIPGLAVPSSMHLNFLVVAHVANTIQKLPEWSE